MSEPLSSPSEGLAALNRLEAERVRILDHLAGLRRGFQEIIDASADSNADDEHDPEGSTIAFERSQMNALIHQAQSHLLDIETAQMRVAGGLYGLCESCGQPISVARLDARPVARTCIACAATLMEASRASGGSTQVMTPS
jgi:DnaK suppressor protein